MGESIDSEQQWMQDLIDACKTGDEIGENEVTVSALAKKAGVTHRKAQCTLEKKVQLGEYKVRLTVIDGHRCNVYTRVEK